MCYILTTSCLGVCSPDQARLCDLEDQAKASKKGMWTEGGGTNTVRDLKYIIENPRNFVDSMHQKPVNGRANTHSYTSSFLFRSPCVHTTHSCIIHRFGSSLPPPMPPYLYLTCNGSLDGTSWAHYVTFTPSNAFFSILSAPPQLTATPFS